MFTPPRAKQPFLFHLDDESKSLIKSTSLSAHCSMSEVIRQMISFCSTIDTLNQLFPNCSGSLCSGSLGSGTTWNVSGGTHQ